MTGYQWVAQVTAATNTSIGWNSVATTSGTATSGTINLSVMGRWSSGASVSQNGALINGIYDSGSNANGSYIRYSDGTMIC